MTPTRLLADRRQGVDRRSEPRRRVVTSAQVERRRVVDRRRGAERRSTLERRHRSGGRSVSRETPAEHVRNALQLLTPLTPPALAAETHFTAALARLKTALALLEQTN